MKMTRYRLAALILAALLLTGCAAETPVGTTAGKSAETTAEMPAATGTAAEQKTAPADFTPDMRFSGTDQNGAPITEQIFAEYRLTMINFWEPWCGPCVGEMPDLEKLHAAHPELLILGVYSTVEGMERVLKETGVTYPVMRFDQAFQPYQTGYVPTTIFVGPDGRVIGEPYIGSRDYNAWEAVVTELVAK